MTNDKTNGRTISILLVEDNPVDTQRIEYMLRKSPDSYQLHSTKTLKDGLQTLNQHAVQVILLDLTLPDSEGVQTIRTLHTSFPRIPIVVLTAVEDEQVMAEAVTAGAQDYLVKQEINATNLWRVLRYALERQSQEEALRASRRAYRRQAEELNILNQIISATVASNDEQTVMDMACFKLGHFYRAHHTLILQYQPETDAVTLQANYSQNKPPVAAKSLPLKDSAQLTAVFITQHTLMCPTISGSLQQYLGVSDRCQAILRLLKIEDSPIGFFVLLLPGTHQMEERDLLLVDMMTDELELGLTKVRLHGRLQAHAAELETRVEERTHALAEANEQLKSLDQLKSKFVSDVSHELRNPVTNLSLYLELLEYAKPDKKSQYVTVLRNQVRRLSLLIEEILTLSRLENGKSEKFFHPVDLNILVQQVIVAHAPRAENKGLTLRFEPGNSLPDGWGEPNQITQVVTNLVDNALNYTAEGGITVITSRQQRVGLWELVLQIVDSGIGIPKKELPHIFKRFYRGTQIDKKQMPGTGLGLGIVYEIVKAHNGRIDVTSIPNQGSTFTVTIPAAPQPES